MVATMISELDRPPADDMGSAAGFVEALRVLRERWWVIVLCMAICAGAAFAYVEHKPKKYTATAKLQFANSTIPSEVAGVPQTQTVDPEGEKATYLQLVTTTPVADLVAKQLHTTESPTELLEEVKATNPKDDYIIDISSTSTSPSHAVAVANAFAQEYVVYSQRQNEAQLIRGEELINRKLEALPVQDAEDRANLKALYQKLLVLQAVQTSNAHVVDVASVPKSPSSPNTTSTVLIALLAGLLIGVGVAFLVNVLDRRLKSLDALEDAYKMPALATVPRLPRRARTSREREQALEPFRILHNSLALGVAGQAPKSVLVTSAVSKEGKTTVALGLARAARDAGQRVVLVEADLRHPSLSDRLQISGSSLDGGLAAALLHGRDPAKLLTDAPNGLSGLRVLTSGSIKANIVDLLKSDALASVFTALGTVADLVVIDSAPLLPVADTRTLLDRATIDMCIVVGRVAVTTKEQARRTRAVLAQRRLQSVGLVVDDTTGSGSYYYGSTSTTPPSPPGVTVRSETA